MQPANDKPKPRLFSRRRFLQGFGVAALAGVSTYVYSSTYALHDIVVEHLLFPIPNLAPSLIGTRLVLLADLHAGPKVSMAYLENAFQISMDLNPKYILISGDLVNSTLSHLAPLADILAPVAAKIPTYAVTGNHDFARDYKTYAFSNTVGKALEDVGVCMLRNQFHQPVSGPGQLCFAGLDDLWSKRMDPSILADVPVDAATILLVHNPDAYEDVANYRWDLMLCGHTHGGQVCVPGIGALIVPVKHKERSQGLFHLDAANPLRGVYVARGTGHGLKVRLFCPPEITCITLARA